MAVKRSTGLVDKLNGVKTNKLLNGTFESGPHDSWIDGSTSTLTSPAGGVTGNCLSIASTAAVAGSAYQDIATVIGRMYKLSLSFKKGTGASGGFAIGTTGSPTSIHTSAAFTDAAWAEKYFIFVATAATTRITLRSDSVTDTHTALFDDVLCEEILDGFVEIMRNCKCNIYSGTRPADADTAATSGNRLVTVSNNSTATGLTFNASSNGVVGKPSGETWTGTIAQLGTAAYYRFYEDGDNPHATSTTSARFDGTIGTSGTDMIVGSTSLTNDLIFQMTGFSYTAPRG